MYVQNERPQKSENDKSSAQNFNINAREVKRYHLSTIHNSDNIQWKAKETMQKN